MKLLAVVVLYYPDETVLANIRTYLSGVDCLLLWDNTPGDSIDKERQRSLQTLEKSVYMSNGSNVGIGAALNGAVDYARQHGFTHLVTFDQDSSFASDDFLCYLEAVRNYGRDVRAIFSTNYFIKSQQAPLYPVEDAVVEVPSAMTSGSLYPLSLFDELGGFMSDLFVWGIDCEFCWRAARYQIPTLCFKNILLQHDLGYQKRKRRLLGKEVFPNEYPPARTYYNVRNGIVLHRLYPEFINLRAHLRYHLYKRVVFVLLYEDRKMAKLRALWLGWLDGHRGKLGVRKDL